MSAKTRYLLPLAQMTIAIGLMWWAQVWMKPILVTHDMAGPAPQFQLLISVNAPLSLPRWLWFRFGHLPTLLDNTFFVLLIGLFWYWVALSLHSWRVARKVRMFSHLPLRVASDAILICVGAILFFSCVDEMARGYQPFYWGPWFWYIFILGLPLAWSVVLIFFFVRDLVQCFLPMKV